MSIILFFNKLNPSIKIEPKYDWIDFNFRKTHYPMFVKISYIMHGATVRTATSFLRHILDRTNARPVNRQHNDLTEEEYVQWQKYIQSLLKGMETMNPELLVSCNYL